MTTGDIAIVIVGGPLPERLDPLHRRAPEPVSAQNRHLRIYRFQQGTRLHLIELSRCSGYWTGV